MKRLINVMAAAAAVVLLVPGAQAAKEKTMSDVKLTLAVQTEQGRVRVGVVLKNEGTRTVYVPRTLAVDKDPPGRLFDVRDADSGEKLGYEGIMIKRGPLKAADFMELKPGAEQQNSIDISNNYSFKAGKRVYQIAYEGLYWADMKEEPDMAKALTLTSAPLLFTYGGK
ncbi:hypothetical protein [Massilia sp. BJB1822]|uniref:hypothetical protein n=1 Tax=Massilia sp. BJB1822 TaxID=2744470 RepID=UPI0015938E14|nr:hypothetical protein [Massilia sp. BJB1822]NVD98044.1 hypothetical protein [Massilia sp. BJB1822]